MKKTQEFFAGKKSADVVKAYETSEYYKRIKITLT